MTDDSKKPSTKPSRRALPKDIQYPDASHPIFSNPTVIGSRANLMRSRPKVVDASEEKEASPSTPSSGRSVERELEETEEDGPRGEPGTGGTA